MQPRLLAAALTLAFAAALPAQDIHVHTPPPAGFTSIEPLWPAGSVPGAKGAEDDDTPRLYGYPAAGPGPHTAVIVIPGGGYTKLVSDAEGGREARWLQAHNISAYVLIYRLGPRYPYPWPQVDGARAVRFVRSHAAAWSLREDAIGIWGFSAGGHMAGYLATAGPHSFPAAAQPGFDSTTAKPLPGYTPMDAVDQLSAHPDFAIINYGRLDLNPAIPGNWHMPALVGDHPSPALMDAINPVLHVTASTSPTFLYANENDATVDSENATSFFIALKKAHVPAELHIFERGPHGTHMGDDQPRYPELAIYPTLLANWLTAHGWLTTPEPQ